MQVEPYLFFEGRCEEALEFYCKALGAEVTALFRFKESPDPGMCPPGAEEKVMHANLRIGDTTIMASDGDCDGPAIFRGFSLSLSLTDTARPSVYSRNWLTADRSRCPWPRRFGRRSSAWSRTVSGYRG